MSVDNKIYTLYKNRRKSSESRVKQRALSLETPKKFHEVKKMLIWTSIRLKMFALWKPIWSE